MPIPLDAPEVLNREFLEIRAKILQIAAALDRIDRADGSVEDDPRWRRLLQGLNVLSDPGPGRAEQVQMIFSLPYDEKWQANFGIVPRR